MTLVVYWYDFVCFGIVAASCIGSLWVLWTKDVISRFRMFEHENTIHENLVDQYHRPCVEMGNEFVGEKVRACVESSQLWTSCWKGLHPGWLVVTRFLSFVVLVGFLSWDIVVWDATIFVYYTEWTFSLVIVYFALGTVVSAYGCWMHRMKIENGEREKFLRGDEEGGRESVGYANKEIKGNARLQSHYSQEEFQQTAGFWGYLMQIIYQTCAGAVILTDIVFWCVIVPFLSNSHLGLNMGI